jgi:hypothetical protein
MQLLEEEEEEEAEEHHMRATLAGALLFLGACYDPD